MTYSFDRYETRPGGLDEEGCPIPYTLSGFSPTQAGVHCLDLGKEESPPPAAPSPKPSLKQRLASFLLTWIK